MFSVFNVWHAVLNSNQTVFIMVLKIGWDRWPVTVPIRSNQLDWKKIEPESNRLNQQFNRQTGRTKRFPSDPTVHFSFPFPVWLVPPLLPGASSDRQRYLHCYLEHHLGDRTPDVGNPTPKHCKSHRLVDSTQHHFPAYKAPPPTGALEKLPFSPHN